jgi:hypothetical protein
MTCFSINAKKLKSRTGKLVRHILNPGLAFLYLQKKRARFKEIAAIVHEMAQTGLGTDDCLQLGCLPMQVHFYSPIPDIKDLEERKVWNKRSEMPGVDFRAANQLVLLKQLGEEFGNECTWPLKPTPDPAQFYQENGSFSFGCAASLHSIIRHFKPRHVIEIGSGFSSRVISDALGLNKEQGLQAEYTIIDPYPGHVVLDGLIRYDRLIQQRVELEKPDIFNSLGDSDLLFIDSGHTVRTGGDVNFLFLEVLPRLNPGVIVHFHDIPLPWEYAKTYFTNPAFRVFWTEAYLLQAFMAFNSEFKVLLALNFLQMEHMDAFCAAFPHFDLKVNWAISGSFWIQRNKKLAE